jgi:phytanoyl-CoA hydroxylase
VISTLTWWAHRLDAVAALLDDEPLLNQTMLYFKPPQGRGQALHQDMAIITIDPLLGVWAPLDKATADVGPMIVIDKSHEDGFVAKRDADMSLSFTEGEAVPATGREAIELTLDEGDVLFFDGRT